MIENARKQMLEFIRVKASEYGNLTKFANCLGIRPDTLHHYLYGVRYWKAEGVENAYETLKKNGLI